MRKLSSTSISIIDKLKLSLYNKPKLKLCSSNSDACPALFEQRQASNQKLSRQRAGIFDTFCSPAKEPACFLAAAACIRRRSDAQKLYPSSLARAALHAWRSSSGFRHSIDSF